MVNLIVKTLRQLSTLLFTCVEILISLLLSALILPPAIILILVNEVVRLFLTVVLRTKFGSSVKLIADGTNNIWSFKKAGNGRTTLCVVFYTNELNVENYRELFYTRVINYETRSGFKPYETLMHIYIKHLGYFCWKKDENFNIKNHVRYYPGSENKIITESELMEVILPDLFIDMEDSVPQWEEIIIPKFQYNVNDKKGTKLAGKKGTVTVKIFRYHHAFMDGATNFLMWISCMMDGEEFPYTVNPLAPSKILVWKRMFYNLKCVLLGATSIIKNLYVTKTINNRFVTNSFTGKRFLSWTPPIDIYQLNKIHDRTKSSLPTIIAAAIGGALRKLDEKYPSKKEEFIRNIQSEVLLGLVAAFLPYPNVHLRNRFTVVHLPINISDIPRLQRLQLAGGEMEKIGKDPICYLNFLMFKIFGRFPNFVIHRILRDTRLPLSFSNAPTAKANIQFWGNEVMECVAWPPLLLNTGLAILTMSYSGHMRVCGVTDEACLSENELKYFLTEIHNEVRLMFEECSKLGRQEQIIFEEKLFIHKAIQDIDIENP